MSFEINNYEYLGDLSAVDPPYVRHMMCHDCKVEWGGCWDNFQCPKCGKGELPTPYTSGFQPQGADENE